MQFRGVLTGLLSLCLTMMLTGTPYASGPVKPTMKDKCPVCGMLVAKYPHWVAEIVFKDGTYVTFDGAKDMFKYYFNIQKYNRAKNKEDIAGIFVTDYYTTEMFRADEVYFVIGSDVRGPMGEEPVPVKGEDNARTFMKDHRGRQMLRFNEISLEVVPDSMK